MRTSPCSVSTDSVGLDVNIYVAGTTTCPNSSHNRDWNLLLNLGRYCSGVLDEIWWFFSGCLEGSIIIGDGEQVAISAESH